jgi:hypothetical protein
MSNRNFDSRVIIQRLQQQNYARNLYKMNVNGQPLINNPQNSDGTSSRLTTFVSGSQTDYFRGLIGAGETISVGGTFGISAILPVPAPIPVPVPVPVPSNTPSAPTITGITPGNEYLVVAFNPPVSEGDSPIANYEYSTDSGSSFFPSRTTTSPIIIAGLTNGTQYNVIIRAVNGSGSGASSNIVPGTPNATVQSFTTVGSTTWTAPIGVTSVEYIVVGGGGGGGGGYDTGSGGGGGGGMVLTGTTITINPGSVYTVVVGAGGVASTNNYPTINETSGGDGVSSSFDTITALGGDGGKSSRTQTGGSGKGGEAQTLSASAVGGSGGGNSGTSAGGSGGGGGGANTAGTNGVPGAGGSGGTGIVNSLSGSSITYGTGGNGARGNTTTSGANGTSNRGNGGGGGGFGSGGARNGGAGGSGIVVIRY